MTSGKYWILTSVVVVMFGPFLLAADDANVPSTQPSGETSKPHHHARLTQPYSEMTTLTADQKTQIENIHAQTLAQRKALDEKEKSDIAAVLGDEQKAELAKLEAAATADRKERSAERRKKMGDESPAPTTEPAQ